MSEHWSWELTNVDHHSISSDYIKILLNNRGHTQVYQEKKRVLLPVLKIFYEVEDKNLKAFNTMTKKQIQVELAIRKASDKIHGFKKRELIERLEANRIPSKLKIPTYKLLIYGFVRTNVKQKLFFLIPYYLKDIICAYAQPNLVAFCFDPLVPNQLHIAQIDDNSFTDNIKSEAKIVTLNSSQTESREYYALNLYTVDSFKIPPHILEPMAHFKETDINANNFKVMFKVATSDNYNEIISPSMLMMNKNHAYIDDDRIAFEWKLPSLSQMAPNSLAYHDNYLISFRERCEKHNRKNPSLCALSFTFNDRFKNKDWKWKRVNKKLNISTRDESASGILIKTSDHKDKYFLCGGFKDNSDSKHRSEIYDFNNNTWKSIETGPKSHYAGIGYDNVTQNIYVGGGAYSSDFDGTFRWARADSDPVDKVQGFDIENGKWYELPSTRMKHGRGATIWNDMYNYNILWMASLSSNGMEYLDLRENTREWRIIRMPKKYQRLSDSLGVSGFRSDFGLCFDRF